MNTGTFDPTKYTKAKFVKGADLPRGRAITITISRAYEHTFEQTGETKAALDFGDFDQSMALNKTQVQTMIDLFGPDPRLWIGKVITLQAIPSQFAGKPTILITQADAPQPTWNGQPSPQPTLNGQQQQPPRQVQPPQHNGTYTREDYERRVQQAQPPQWQDEPDDKDVPF